jgi:hypothetical protein
MGTPAILGLVAGTCAVGIEVLFRATQLSWPVLFVSTLPLQVVINYAIFQIVRGDSILAVAIWFSGTTSVLRLVAQLSVGGTVSPLTWVAYGLTVVALLVKTYESLVVR